MLKILTFIAALSAILYYYYFQSPNKTKTPSELRDSYDYIIAGGGTAGCVLAARLSEDPNVNVLLLEAGGEEIDVWYYDIVGFLMDLQLTDFDWQYKTEPQKYCCNALKNKQGNWPRGKALGGSSSHNWVNYVRGSPKDFDYWGKTLNISGWSFKDVLPYFKKLETYEIPHLKGRTDGHGFEGPIKINEGYRTPFGEAAYKALKREGHIFLDDTNSGKEYEGFSWVQFNVGKDGRRVSTAKGHLRPAMERPNLHVVVRAHVSKVIIENEDDSLRARGVEYFYKGKKHIAKAKREVIVSGGAINSPQLLMLSGIGPKAQLDKYEIPVLVDNPAVGNNLDDHIIALLNYKTNASGLTDGHLMNTWYGDLKALVLLHLFGKGPLTKTAPDITGFVKSGLLPGDWPDLQLYFCGRDPLRDDVIHLTEEAAKRRAMKGEGYSAALIVVMNHATDTGELRLQSSDPFVHPIIEHHYFKSSVDVDAMAKGLRFLVDIVENNAEFKQLDAQYAESGPVPGCEKLKPLTDEYLKCSIRNRAFTLYHPVGTCRMGQKGNNSVVDNELRVHGVNGLRVADASVFPSHISGNTHATTIMVGEKASDLIKKKLMNDKTVCSVC